MIDIGFNSRIRCYMLLMANFARHMMNSSKNHIVLIAALLLGTSYLAALHILIDLMPSISPKDPHYAESISLITATAWLSASSFTAVIISWFSYEKMIDRLVDGVASSACKQKGKQHIKISQFSTLALGLVFIGPLFVISLTPKRELIERTYEFAEAVVLIISILVTLGDRAIIKNQDLGVIFGGEEARYVNALNIGTLVAVAVTVAAAYVYKGSDLFGPRFGYGFASGALAFELLVANITFSLISASQHPVTKQTAEEAA